jgi:hypothetical protein
MLGKIVAISSIAAIILLFFLVNTTTPATAGPLGILGVFVLMYIALIGVATYFLFGTNKVFSKVSTAFMGQRPAPGLSFRRAYYFGSVIALGPVMFVGLQSVGKVGVQEVVLVVLFMVLGCVYIARRVQ